MLTLIISLVLFALAIQIFPIAIGIDQTKDLSKGLWFGVVLVSVQIIFFLVGHLLGEQFMHLLKDFKGVVFFAGLFLIGVRVIMEAFKVRKGERTYLIDNTQTALLASVAQGINAFLGGILFTLLAFDRQWLTMTFLIFTAIVVIAGFVLKPTRQSYLISSILFFMSGLVMIVASVYLGFISN